VWFWNRVDLEAGTIRFGAKAKPQTRSGAIREVACMAHVRRKFVDIHRSQGSLIAEEAIGRIAQLYAVEKEARGSPPDRRAELRQAHAARDRASTTGRPQ
jgi:hypothetical protein